jgi:hypothetical protein
MPSPKPTSSPPGSTPDSLFVAWLARHEAGQEADFEALCGEHPAAASELRELHGHWAKVETLRRRLGLGGSLSEKLASHYGSGVDPGVTLEGEEQGEADFSSEVLSRLAGRGPASTRYRVEGAAARVCRGGSFAYGAIIARSASRNDGSAINAIQTLGVRPAKALDPGA